VTTDPATVLTLVVLSLAGLLPVLALVGLRVISVPLLPLGGAVLAAVASTFYLAFGLSFIGWFVALAAAAALVVLISWVRRPDRRPWRRLAAQPPPPGPWHRPAGIIGAVAILAACIWSLRGLATPTVGFDARALWLMRAGWLLQSHHQLLIDMRLRNLLLYQTTYPPLVSAVTAVAWHVTGNQSDRLGVVVVALLNTCALAVGAFALVEAGRQCANRARTRVQGANGVTATSDAPPRDASGLWPLVVSIVVAVLLIFVAFGTTEPFMTNGYADPIWTLAAVGAVAYGLQLGMNRVNQTVALLLVLVAGLSKDEGLATAAVLLVLLTLRAVGSMSAEDRRTRWWRPVLPILAVAIAIGAWPALIRVLHARGLAMTYSPLHDIPGRARTAFDGFSPYLHVIVLAAPLAIVGGVVLSALRRRGALANDWWAWAAWAGGLAAVGTAYITGTVPVQQWLVGTVDRVSEFPVLTAWWIVAVWAIVASSAWRAPIGHGDQTQQQTLPADPVELQPEEQPGQILTVMAE
jgi:hypothetical protein